MTIRWHEIQFQGDRAYLPEAFCDGCGARAAFAKDSHILEALDAIASGNRAQGKRLLGTQWCGWADGDAVCAAQRSET